MSEPPRKKQKYMPGGPGGGGRYGDTIAVGTPRTERPQSARRERLLRTATSTNATPYERPERPRRERRAPQHEPITRPRYSSAAAAAAAVVQGDGFKPREERGWEEFHEHLEIDVKLPVFSSGLVDGTEQLENDEESVAEDQDDGLTPGSPRKRRTQRSQSAMLNNLEIPKAAVPIPGPNPREKLTLPRPSYKMVDPFVSYEQANGSIDYVDKAMANVGYQESDHFDRPERGLIRLAGDGIDEELETTLFSDAGTSKESILPRVEYDMDEQDQKWLEQYNQWRKTEGVEPLRPAIFEMTMTKIEKEWHALEKRIPKPNPKPPQTHRPRSSSAAAVNGEPVPDGEEQDTKCAICDDGDCENTNAIVFCDGCDLAVHQECYGVPFIPEGQWLCRRCHLAKYGTPTCVFCPNTDGAFKQTNSAQWAHLLCAIWIPEVSLGNTTFMEPVMDVEKVPKSRWKLTCDICKQKMGACIQCTHKACYTAFHVTCARRARWQVSMRSGHGGSAILDSSILHAYCGNHVSEEWAITHNTHKATKLARKYYKKAMRGKIWNDSHQGDKHQPVIIPPAPVQNTRDFEEAAQRITLTNKNANKKATPTKPTWKLSTGAPVVPSVLFLSVDSSLQKLSIRRRREFAVDMCKYWTLKRESKRGAALIKRLQLQMETFSSMEITRRSFAGMGAIGGPRLQRRIDFADNRIQEVGQLLEISSLLKDREEQKLQDAEIMRDFVDTVYFPIPPLLWQILEKAEHHDTKDVFKAGLDKIKERLQQRGYASVIPITADLNSVFVQALNHNSMDANQALSHTDDNITAKKILSADDKGKRNLAKRILKAIHPSLEDALLKESQLNGLSHEGTLLDLEQLLQTSLPTERLLDLSPSKSSTSRAMVGDAVQTDAEAMDIDTEHTGKDDGAHNHLTPKSTEVPLEDVDVDMDADGVGEPDDVRQEIHQAPTPPLSTNSSHLQGKQNGTVHAPETITPLTLGGVPSYMQGFEPSGLTVYDDPSVEADPPIEAAEEENEPDPIVTEPELEPEPEPTPEPEPESTPAPIPVVKASPAAVRGRPKGSKNKPKTEAKTEVKKAVKKGGKKGKAKGKK